MDKPKVAGTQPVEVELEAGKKYAWCTCGLSTNQPFCDGSHTPSNFKPLVFAVDESRTAYLCCCKQTKNPPYCDGSHKTVQLDHPAVGGSSG